MSVVAVLQGTEAQGRQSTLTAVELARRLNAPVTGLFALPDPNAVLMVAATPEASGLTASTAQSIIDLQLAMKTTAETARARRRESSDAIRRSVFQRRNSSPARLST